jgi:hypothetical protein
MESVHISRSFAGMVHTRVSQTPPSQISNDYSFEQKATPDSAITSVQNSARIFIEHIQALSPSVQAFIDIHARKIIVALFGCIIILLIAFITHF